MPPLSSAISLAIILPVLTSPIAARDDGRRLDDPVVHRTAPEISVAGVKDDIEADKIAAQAPDLIWFRNGRSLRPERGLDPALTAPPQGIALLQFSGRIEKEWIGALADLGIVVHDHVQSHAVLAEVPAKASDGLLALFDRGVVRYIGPYPPEAKVDKALDPAPGSVARVVVQFFGDPDEAVLASVAGIMTVEHGAGAPLPFVRGAAGGKQIAAIARLDRVKWIEPYHPGELHNIEAAMASGADDVVGSGLFTGGGIRVAVDDTGIARTGSLAECGGTGAAYHPDIASGRIADEWDFFNNDANACDDDAHGTHTAGTIGGDGTLWDDWTGIAPDVTFLIYKDADPNGGFGHFEQVLSRAAAHDADIVANSWGGGNGVYGTASQLADRAVLGDWNGSDGLKQYMFLTVSSGNDNDLTSGPATGKNVVAVGATKDGNVPDNVWCWGVHVCTSHPGCPCTPNNRCGDRYWPAEDRICFSNHGPVDTDGDGNVRIKPDVVAPGTRIFSLAAPYLHPTGDSYRFSDGTSMAQPVVAGVAALMLDAYPNILDWPEMTKARLLATATPLGPTSLYGHGMVDALHAVYSTASFSTQLWEGGAISATGNERDFTFTVPSGFQQVRVYLAWSDVASTTTEVVNDLDLRVYDGSGTLVGSSATYDDTVEWVRLTGGTPGTWRANVRGFSLPQPNAYFGIYAGVELLPGSLGVGVDPNGLCIGQGDWFEIETTLVNTGHTAAASELRIDLPDTPGLFTLHNVVMPSHDPGRGHVYQASEIVHQIPTNQYSIFTGEVNTTIPRRATWSLQSGTGTPDGNYPFFAYGTAHGFISYGDIVDVRVDSVPPGGAANLHSTTHPAGTCWKQDYIWMTWDPATDTGCGLDGYGVEWGIGGPALPAAFKDLEESQTVYFQQMSESVVPWYFSIRSVDNAGNWSPTFTSYGPMWVDATPPGAVTSLASESHPTGACTDSTDLFMLWDHAPDDNCGTDGYSISLTTGGPAMPDPAQNLAHVDQVRERVPESHAPWYFNIRARDAGDNWSSTYASHGPFWVDPIPPELSGLNVARSGDDLVLWWNGIAEADWYHLYKDTLPWFPSPASVGGDLPLPQVTEANGAIDPNPVVYYVAVGANICGADGP